MCRSSCCPPGGTGTGLIVAVIAGFFISVRVIPAVVNFLKLLALITLIGIAATAVIGLIFWAVTWRADRNATRHNQPGHRTMTRRERRIARQFAHAIADHQDPAAIDRIIGTVLDGHDT